MSYLDFSSSDEEAPELQQHKKGILQKVEYLKAINEGKNQSKEVNYGGDAQDKLKKKKTKTQLAIETAVCDALHLHGIFTPNNSLIDCSFSENTV